MRRWYRPSNRRIFVSSVKPAVCRSNGKPVGGCTRTPTRGGKRAYTRTRAGEEARHRCAPLGQILQTILAFAPIFFPREKDGEDTRAKGREKMNLRSKLTRRSYSSRTSFLGYVRGKDYHYVGRIDSFRFSPSSPGV